MTSVVDLDQTIGRAIIFQPDWVINARALLREQVLRDLPHRMIGEVLANFREDPLFHVGMEGATQVGKRARRRGNDEGRDGPAAYHTLQRSGHPSNETVLLKAMPVSLIDTAAPMRAGPRKGRAWLVGALLMSRRILISKNLLSFQIGKFFVTIVAQEQRLAAVADENQGVVRNCELVHI